MTLATDPPLSPCIGWSVAYLWTVGESGRTTLQRPCGGPRVLPGVTSDVMNNRYHQWTKALSKEQLQQHLDFYKKKYNQ